MGDIASTSIGRCAVRVCHPGGSRPHDFFQLDRPIEPLKPGDVNAPVRFCAMNVVLVVVVVYPRRESSPDDPRARELGLEFDLKGDPVRYPSTSEFDRCSWGCS
jgi:hypothetical protein